MNRLALYGAGLLLAGSLAYSLAAQTPGADDDLDVTVPSFGGQAAAAGELTVRRAYVEQLEALVARLQPLHDQGRSGGEAENLFQATTALEIARAELATAENKPREMAHHYAQAARAADQNVKAVQAAYDVGRAPLGELLSALKTQAQVKLTLVSLRR